MATTKVSYPLIGQRGSRDSLPTPALVIDRNIMVSNMAAMTGLLAGTTMSHRPHFKAHKCLEICRLQLDAGANGFCAATIGEAEVLSVLDTSVLLTSIVASDINLGRAADLRANGCDLTLVVDSLDTAQRMSTAFEDRECVAKVLLDIDTGRHRSGCRSPAAAVGLAEAIDRLPGLSLHGMQLYAGHLSHMCDPVERQRSHRKFRDDVVRYRNELAAVLPDSPVISGGSTGSLALDLENPVLNELQCGSYVFMDVEYLAIPFSTTSTQWPFGAALAVQASILSSNWSGHAIADAGDKRFASKYGQHPQLTRVPCGVSLAGAAYTPVSDEHGRLDFTSAQPPAVGSRLECVVPHCDPSINLFDVAHVVSGDVLTDVWRIDARGA